MKSMTASTMPELSLVEFSSLSGENVSMPVHSHDYIELICVMLGQISVTCGGNTHILKAGDLIEINPRLLHEIFTPEGTPAVYQCLKFDTRLLFSVMTADNDYFNLLALTDRNVKNGRLFPSGNHSGFGELFAVLTGEMREKQIGYELAVRSIVGQITVMMLRRLKGTAVTRRAELKNETASNLRAAISYIWEHYAEPLTVTEMAKRSYMCKSSFSNHFREFTGKTFVAYLNYIRVMQSLRQLEAGGTLEEVIAYSVGFSSLNYYIENFKLYMGMSPRQYKSKMINPQQKN